MSRGVLCLLFPVSGCTDAKILSVVPIPLRNLVESHAYFLRDRNLMFIGPDRRFIEVFLQDGDFCTSLTHMAAREILLGVLRVLLHAD